MEHIQNIDGTYTHDIYNHEAQIHFLILINILSIIPMQIFIMKMVLHCDGDVLIWHGSVKRHVKNTKINIHKNTFTNSNKYFFEFVHIL